MRLRIAAATAAVALSVVLVVAVDVGVVDEGVVVHVGQFDRVLQEHLVVVVHQGPDLGAVSLAGVRRANLLCVLAVLVSVRRIFVQDEHRRVRVGRRRLVVHSEEQSPESLLRGSSNWRLKTGCSG